jgi:NAD(P)-dependent dehydrogenase (short-subunit alcohol dehydrogenase family)
MGRLSGKRARVTGAAAGIGEATARRLAAEGAEVIGIDATPTYPGTVADVSDPRQVADAFSAAGELDICIANAGVSLMEPFVDGDPEAWRRVLMVNLFGVMLTLQAAARAMRPGGRLLATASIAGLHGEPGAAAYCSSKAGVVGLVRTLAIELAPLGITANAVAPGQIETRMSLEDLATVSARQDRSAADLLREHLDLHVPVRRLGTPGEVAALFAFLASDEAGFINGEVIRIDGGELAG